MLSSFLYAWMHMDMTTCTSTIWEALRMDVSGSARAHGAAASSLRLAILSARTDRITLPSALTITERDNLQT